jgi:O-antigen/teichoic acid export membrane protein
MAATPRRIVLLQSVLEVAKRLTFARSTRQLWLDYAVTYSAMFGVMATGLLTYRFASLNFGEEQFSQYALARRVITFLLPLLALGTAVSLSRKVAGCRFDSRHANEAGFIAAALTLMIASAALFTLAVLAAPRLFALLFFGDSKFDYLAIAIVPMLVGLGFHVVCYAQFHGRLSMRWANVILLLNTGLVPLAVVAVSSNVETALGWTGLAVALVSLAAILLQLRAEEFNVQGVGPALRELIQFGPRRVPGDLAFVALLMLPATLVTYSCGIRLGGLVAFCMTLLTFGQAMTMPISTMLLPQATEMLRSGRLYELRRNAILLLICALSISTLGIIVFWFAQDAVLRLCLGNYAPELPALATILMLGVVPLNCHTCLRSIVDAGNDLAINARSSCVALGCFFVVWWIASYAVADLYAAPVALVFALLCLASLSLREAWQILKPTSNWAQPPLTLLRREAA